MKSAEGAQGIEMPSRLIWGDLEVPKCGNSPPSDESLGAAVDYLTVVDYLMGTLLEKAPSILQAEFVAEGPIAWVLRREGKHVEEVYRSRDGGQFRSVLARIGGHYMDVQLYGGYVQRVLIYEGQRWMCRIYMSNMGGSGLWIRAYAMHRVEGERANSGALG